MVSQHLLCARRWGSEGKGLGSALRELSILEGKQMSKWPDLIGRALSGHPGVVTKLDSWWVSVSGGAAWTRRCLALERGIEVSRRGEQSYHLSVTRLQCDERCRGSSLFHDAEQRLCDAVAGCVACEATTTTPVSVGPQLEAANQRKPHV